MDMVQEGQNKHTPKLIELHKIVEEGKEDRLSALPDCLLLDILSRLPTTDVAITTGTLSKRWEHLWTSVPSLILFLIHRRPDIVPSVNKTLNQCRQPKLKKFEVTTIYDTRFKSEFNNWITYAISCRAEKLSLTFANGTNFVLDQCFFINTCVTDLKLFGCMLIPIGAISWKNLRRLSISREKLDEDLIENILSGSPVLETLELRYCCGYRLLNITSKSVKNLMFSGFQDPDPDTDMDDNIIEINAPNILSLTIKMDLLGKLLLLNVSSVVKANLDFSMSGYWWPTNEVLKEEEEDEEEMLKEFILNLRHVKKLKLGPFDSTVVSRLEAKGFIFPSNVKFSDVTCDCSDSDSVESGD